MPEDKYLDIRDLDAGYGRSQVLFGVTLNVPWRGGVAILGRNGAGKTTLMKAIVGELPLLGGSIMLDSRDVGQLPTEKRIRLGVGYVPQEHAVFARLSVRDNLAVGAMTNRDSRAVNRILEIFPKLGQRMDQVAGTLSGGERKMLAIGRALLSDPRLLLLDEPTEGVWIGVIEEITERLVVLAKEIAVVIVEQHLDLALQVASHAYVLDRGRVALVGSLRLVPPMEPSSWWSVRLLDVRKRFRSREMRMIYRVAAAVFAGSLLAGAAAAQSTTPSGEKPETNCTTSPAATTGRAGEKTSNSMAMEKSAILPDAGGSNSAAPTVQSGGKPMEVRSECPLDSKAK